MRRLMESGDIGLVNATPPSSRGTIAPDDMTKIAQEVISVSDFEDPACPHFQVTRLTSSDGEEEGTLCFGRNAVMFSSDGEKVDFSHAMMKIMWYEALTKDLQLEYVLAVDKRERYTYRFLFSSPQHLGTVLRALDRAMLRCCDALNRVDGGHKSATRSHRSLSRGSREERSPEKKNAAASMVGGGDTCLAGEREEEDEKKEEEKTRACVLAGKRFCCRLEGRDGCSYRSLAWVNPACFSVLDVTRGHHRRFQWGQMSHVEGHKDRLGSSKGKLTFNYVVSSAEKSAQFDMDLWSIVMYSKCKDDLVGSIQMMKQQQEQQQKEQQKHEMPIAYP